MSIFNIRVYGLLINTSNEVLVTDEFRMGQEMTKFPGGGLIWGEGTIDCVKREFREELGCEIEIVQHLYTTDHFQLSAFHKEHQLISIYYIVRNTTPIIPAISQKINDFDKKEDAQSFRWIAIDKINETDFTFPIDKKTAAILRSTFQSQGK